MIFHFMTAEGRILGEVALKDADSKLWKFQVHLPERFQADGVNPAGLVFTQTAARKIAEMILTNSIVSR